MSESIDAPDHIEELSVADQHMFRARVVRKNLTLLYQHLAVADILPALVEKGMISEANRKEVETYAQKYAQHIVIIGSLFSSEYPADGLVRLSDVLAMTPGQEQVAGKLLDGENINCCPGSGVTRNQTFYVDKDHMRTYRYMVCLMRFSSIREAEVLRLSSENHTTSSQKCVCLWCFGGTHLV